MRRAGHMVPGKDDRGLRFNSKVDEVPSLTNKTTVPHITKSPGSPTQFTKEPSSTAITVTPDPAKTSPYQSQGSARNLHLPLEPPTFTAPPPPASPPPPLPIKTSPMHRRPQSHPFSSPSPASIAPPPPPPPPPMAPAAPPLPPKTAEEKPKDLLKSTPSTSSRMPTPTDLASIKLKPVSPTRNAPNGRQKASPMGTPGADYVNADFLAEIRDGGTLDRLRKTKTNKSQLGKGSPTGSSSSTPSVASAASSSSSSPTRSVTETVKTPETAKTPDIDNPDIPEWKRQFLAKKAAEKQKKLDQEKKQQEADDKKYADMPPWKAELFKRRDALAKEYAKADAAENRKDAATSYPGAEAEAKAKSEAPPPPAPKPLSPMRSLTARSPMGGGNMKPWELKLLQARQGKQ